MKLQQIFRLHDLNKQKIELLEKLNEINNDIINTKCDHKDVDGNPSINNNSVCWICYQRVMIHG